MHSSDGYPFERVEMKTLIATMDVKPEFKERLLQENQAEISLVVDELGCMRYDLLEDGEYPNRIHIHEGFKNQPTVDDLRSSSLGDKWKEILKDRLTAPCTGRDSGNVYPVDGAWT